MSDIHPTAIIEDGATIGKHVKIGAYSVIGAHVTLADNCDIKSHVVIDGHTEIGENTIIYPFASIGTAPQDLKYAGEPSRLIIGKNNKIREHVTINPGTKDDTMETRVGDNNLFMMASHVAHDCVVGNNCILANNATLAGHVKLGSHVIIGGLSAVHQFIRIGDHAIIGGMSGVEADVIPYGLVKGERAGLAGLNLVGLERRGFARDKIKLLQKAFQKLFKGKGTFEERIQFVRDAYGQEDTVMSILSFIDGKTRFPICQPKQ